MIVDLLSGAGLASDLIERTSSTVRVQEIVRLSLAPAFLLAGIGAVMNVIMNRLIWIAGRIDKLEDHLAEHTNQRERAELLRLKRRRHYSLRATIFATSAALIICLVIALLFISAFITPQIGTFIALLWIASMIALVTGLMLFAIETVIASRGQSPCGDPDSGS
jgi:hypothetical protein